MVICVSDDSTIATDVYDDIISNISIREALKHRVDTWCISTIRLLLHLGYLHVISIVTCISNIITSITISIIRMMTTRCAAVALALYINGGAYVHIYKRQRQRGSINIGCS